MTNPFNLNDVSVPPQCEIYPVKHDELIKIKPNNLNYHFVTIQYFDGSYITTPYIPSNEKAQGYEVNLEQQKKTHSLDDALFHAHLLLDKWISSNIE